MITAGQLDTNLIKVYAGDELRFQLNADGLFAYKSDEIGEALLNEYVVHNSEGLFLVAPKKQSIATLAEEDTDSNEGLELIKKVEISWNGLILRNDDGEKVFYADPETGNLIIAGEINAATGKIAGWTIEENSLLSGDIQSNGLSFAGIQSIHKLDENENSPYPIF